MKKCYRCCLELVEEEFPMRRGSRIGVCRDCYKAHYGDPDQLDRAYSEKVRNTNHKRKERCRSYLYDILLKSSCVDCGLSDPIVLEFDHRNPEEKYRDVSLLVQQGSIELLKTEVSKCDIVCANCHRRRTVKAHTHWRVRFTDTLPV